MKRFHLDKRAPDIVSIGRLQLETDQLISTKQLAEWTGTSVQLWEISRCKDDEGPPWIKLSPRCVRYRVGGVIKWLESRTLNQEKQMSVAKLLEFKCDHFECDKTMTCPADEPIPMGWVTLRIYPFLREENTEAAQQNDRSASIADMTLCPDCLIIIYEPLGLHQNEEE